MEDLICSQCKKECEYVNIGRYHWGFCKDCKTKWLIGINLFSGWRDENEEIWNNNYELLKDFKDIS